MRLFNNLEEAKEAEKVVFIGYDSYEDPLAKMCANSIRRHTEDKDLIIVPVIRDYLLAYNVCNRPVDKLGSTQFTITRFMVPYLMEYNTAKQ